eukprot:TRINITY_DN5176_c0_g1_i16.p1 TRINITY_DN5176_c0_g1~~TRINITY_DN5176_c0_g1_i16.p1  ORF type:complete len:102 (-),score=2.50 TRINITY_DN5176_c0_g1_i16:505-810(-)
MSNNEGAEQYKARALFFGWWQNGHKFYKPKEMMYTKYKMKPQGYITEALSRRLFRNLGRQRLLNTNQYFILICVICLSFIIFITCNNFSELLISCELNSTV